MEIGLMRQLCAKAPILSSVACQKACETWSDFPIRYTNVSQFRTTDQSPLLPSNIRNRLSWCVQYSDAVPAMTTEQVIVRCVSKT